MSANPRTIRLTDHQRTALRILGAKYDCTTQDIISLAVDTIVRCEMAQDHVLALSIAKACGISWEELEAHNKQYHTAMDMAAGQALANAL